MASDPRKMLAAGNLIINMKDFTYEPLRSCCDDQSRVAILYLSDFMNSTTDTNQY